MERSAWNDDGQTLYEQRSGRCRLCYIDRNLNDRHPDDCATTNHESSLSFHKPIASDEEQEVRAVKNSQTQIINRNEANRIEQIEDGNRKSSNKAEHQLAAANNYQTSSAVSFSTTSSSEMRFINSRQQKQRKKQAAAAKSCKESSANVEHEHAATNKSQTGCHKCQLIIDWTRAQASMASKIKQQQQLKSQDDIRARNRQQQQLKGDCLACKKKHDHLAAMGAISKTQKDKSFKQTTKTTEHHRIKHSSKSETNINENLDNNKSSHQQHKQHHCKKRIDDQRNDHHHQSEAEDNDNYAEHEPELQSLDSSLGEGERLEVGENQVESGFDSGRITDGAQSQPQSAQYTDENEMKLTPSSRQSGPGQIFRRLPQRLSARLAQLVTRTSGLVPPETPPRLDILRKQPVANNEPPNALRKSPKRRMAPLPPERVHPPSATAKLHQPNNQKTSSINNCDNNQVVATSRLDSGDTKQADECRTGKKFKRLLTEQEVMTLEHALRSHKSSLYVAGCLANLYLTKTKLFDNGRKSRPENDEWQLKQTGVPILTFDSGLARNRRKRQLKINLTERESGFVLWSDTIDHLSNYHAANETNSSNGFHVMYLSHDHRLMAGLAFDDPTCASLFLAQIELVTADPRNISLTGPKLMASAHAISHGQTGSCAKSKKKLKQRQILSLDQQLHRHNQRKFGDLLNSSSGTSSAEPIRYTWSTLKRAMCRQAHHQLSSKLRHMEQATSSKSNEEQLEIEGSQKFTSMQERSDYLNATRLFRLKPLPTLAAAGGHQFGFKGSSLGSGSKKTGKNAPMPRKCDISAPCLFQHITRVSTSQLNDLPALSQYLTIRELSTTINDQEGPATTNGQHSKSTHNNDRHQTEQTAETRDWRRRSIARRSSHSPSSMKNPTSSHQLANTSCNSGSASSGFISSSSAGCASSISSSASCASTASSVSCSDGFVSPAVSECGEARLQNERHQTGDIKIVATRNLSRSNEPKMTQPSAKSTSRPLPPTRMQQPPPPPPVGLNHQQRANEKHKIINTNSSETKIHAMIRELESHASAETVCAKRRLMADIAGQLERARKLKSTPFEVRKFPNSDNNNWKGVSSDAKRSLCNNTGASEEPPVHVSRL